MPLPLNTETTIGGIAVVVKSVPEKSSGPNTGTRDRPENGADLAVSAYSGAPGGGSNSYSSKPKGRNIPDFSGLDKALGVLGAAVAIFEAGKGLFALGSSIVSGLFVPKSPLTNAQDNSKSAYARGLLSGSSGIGSVDSNVSKGDHRVKIWTDYAVFGENPYFKLLNETGGLVFPYTPNISLTYKANYTQQEGIVHNNFPYQAYKNSQVEDITIQAEFTVQNVPEGQYFLAAMNFFKTATKMFYGASTPVGFPPVVCRLSGYGTEMLPAVPIVIKSFQLDLKDSVQYIEVPGLNSAKDKQMVPTMCTVTVVCSPIYSREQTRQFDIAKFSRGDLLGYM